MWQIHIISTNKDQNTYKDIIIKKNHFETKYNTNKEYLNENNEELDNLIVALHKMPGFI